MRKATAFQLDQHAYEMALKTVNHPRRRVLLDWLRDDSADSATLFDWLKGDGFIILRQESPFMAILQALPIVENPIEPAVKKILLNRLGEVIKWLASDQGARESCAPRTWMEIFNLASRLGGKEELALSISKLRQAFENDESTLFSGEYGDGFAKAFTKLVINHQLNNELERRWTELIRGERDPLLKASLFDAIRGLLSEPEMISYETLEESLDDFCQSLTIAYQSDDIDQSDHNKREKVEELRAMIYADFRLYKPGVKLALANLSRHHQWLPEADPLLLVIAMTTDHAVLAQLKNQQNAYSDLAAFKYKIMCEATPFFADLREHMIRRSLEQAPVRRLAVGKSNFSDRVIPIKNDAKKTNSESLLCYAEQVKSGLNSGI